MGTACQALYFLTLRRLAVRGFHTSCSVRQPQLRSIQDIRKELRTKLGATSAWARNDEARRKLAATMPRQQDQLMARRMQDSYSEALVPLSDFNTREKYRGLHENVQFGLLLENLDTFAVYISYQHNKPSSLVDGGSPYSIVTAMVDEIHINDYNKFTVDDDIRMGGHVCWVGKSSMEIKMRMTQNGRPMVDALFVMVARDPCNVAAVVHPLRIDDDNDHTMFQEGEKHKAQRLDDAQYSLLKEPPSEEERKIVHNLFTQTLDTKTMSFRSRRLPESCIWMEDTKLKTSLICFPQKRNIHNKIFGGFLMRKGFEHAWANGCVFAKTTPIIKAVDDILFRCPVSIGSLLLMSSQVSYSEGNSFHVRVHAEVLNPMTGVSTTCNTFNFTFECDQTVPTVMPRTYGESMLYLDGRRHVSFRPSSET